MHLDALVLTPQSDDPVARNRVAAAGQAEGNARGQPLDRDRLALGGGARRDVGPRRSRHQRLHHRLVGQALAGDRHHQRVGILQLQFLDRPAERFGGQRGGQAGDDLVVNLVPQLDRLVAFLVAHEAPHGGTRLSGDHEAQPARLGMLRVGNQDFDLVAIVEQGAQRHHASVDLGTDGLVAECGVDGISKVDRGRALGQLDQLALRGKGEDPVLVHRHPGMLEQFFGAVGMVEDFDQILDPRHLDLVDRPALLIGPVRRQPALGLGVHRLVADLDLDPHL